MSLSASFAGLQLKPVLQQCMLCLSEWSWELVVARNALRHTGRSMESKQYEWHDEDHWMETAKPYLLMIAAISFIVMVGALCTSP
jgi:hypothetical protein